MMWEALFSLIADAVVGLINLLPDWEPPAWIAEGAAKVAQVMGYAQSLGNWVPLTLFAGVVTAIVIALGVALAIKAIRIAASFATLGGGAAG